MTDIKENRSRYLKVRLKPSELETLERLYKKTTFQTLSDYGRAMILGEPVIVIYRDRSTDELMEELALLRRELSAIGNNLNQAVRNINQQHGHVDSRLWMQLLTVINGKVEPAITQIRDRITETASLWLQRLKAARA